MKQPVEMTNCALCDADEIARKYYDEREELCVRFERALESIIERIAENPRQFAEEELVIRLAPVDGFPYSVYY